MFLHNFSNYGYIQTSLPESLFKALKEECYDAENSRYGKSNHHPQSKTYISGTGTALHFDVIDNAEELKKYALHVANAYITEFNFMDKFRMLTNNVNYIASQPWINVQERGEYIPNHIHDGFLSYAIWMTIPYDVEEELKNSKTASVFQFTYSSTCGDTTMVKNIPVSKQMEGTMVMFPSNMQHCVYPFFTTEKKRHSISGNIMFDTGTMKRDFERQYNDN
jgi:hypothetical protein